MTHQAMFQYERDVFSVIYNGKEPQQGDYAQVPWKTMLHNPSVKGISLKIVEIIETRQHKTDATKMIAIVKCEAQ